jgi:glycosyltransferase involved in cell wall biosynthesis
MAEIVVAIPTFRRPRSLGRLLDELEKLQTMADVSVLVADNDAERHEGFDLCEGARAKARRWPLDAIVVAERGIAQVRNALLERALADPSMRFVAMLDDDEWPERQWLDALLRVQRQTGADVLQGSILFTFEKPPGAWGAQGDGLMQIRRATGPAEMLQGAGNLRIGRACVEAMAKPWFDPAFALSGGEDRDFFVRLARAGVRFAWADEAVAHGIVPASRTTLKWALARAYSIGNSDMRVFLKHRPGMGALGGELVKIAGALLLSPFLSVILVSVPNRCVDAMRRFFRAAGKAAAIFGRQYNEYSVTHGE